MTRPLTASLDELRAALSSPGDVVLDVLPSEAFVGGHIPGATNLPLRELPRALERDEGLPPREAEIVVYCTGPT